MIELGLHDLKATATPESLSIEPFLDPNRIDVDSPFDNGVLGTETSELETFHNTPQTGSSNSVPAVNVKDAFIRLGRTSIEDAQKGLE